MNVALVLPLFYEYARRLRQGVLEWVDRHPGWQVIEIDPLGSVDLVELEEHLHGAIIWDTPKPDGSGAIRFRHISVVDCGSGEMTPPSSPGPARITFDRETINKLAVEHFRELGLEAAGYVGCKLRKQRQWVPRVAGMRQAALDAGMEWISLDLGEVDPGAHPRLLWNGHLSEQLVAFLRDTPKPLGLLAQDDYIGAMICDTAIRIGIEIPGEIAVLGQGNRVVGQTGRLPLSSVIIPGREVGMAAAELLDAWMKGKPPRPWSRLVPCRDLAVRRSTGGLSLDLGIERARRHFDRHALTGVTVQELAAIAGCSAKTLRNRFAELYGFEISHTIRERRTEEALKLLTETDMEIGDIGRHCGFPSAPNFFNFITRQTGGIGPAEYRRRAQGT